LVLEAGTVIRKRSRRDTHKSLFIYSLNMRYYHSSFATRVSFRSHAFHEMLRTVNRITTLSLSRPLLNRQCRTLLSSYHVPLRPLWHKTRCFSVRGSSNSETPHRPDRTRTLKELRENIYTLPNLLTMSRILACPLLGWSILQSDFHLATALLVYAGLTDLVCIFLLLPFPFL